VGARFCPSCGVAQGTASAGERRVVTVVFADLAGFTTMAEGRDPEAVKDLLDTCFGALVPVIDAHGGVVDKIIGDELMAVFGAPRAHEDDAERAVRAGLSLIAALTRLDPSLEMRVGINTGEVLAGVVGPGGAYTVTGDTVNTAHRLVGVARRGTVLVAERTYAATQQAIAYGSAVAHHLRGRTEPVVAHQALRVRHRPGVRSTSAPLAPMIGRVDELHQLVGLVADSVATVQPRLATIVGEPGVGKSRLLDELPSALRGRGLAVRMLHVACASYGNEGPLAPVAAMVRAALDIDEQIPVDEQRAALDARVQELPLADHARQPLVAQIQRLLGLSDQPSTSRLEAGPVRRSATDELVAATRTLLDAVAAGGAMVIVIDDVHHADPLVLGQLERVPVWDVERAVTMVAVGRDDLTTVHPPLVTPRSVRHLLLTLGPLDDDASRELLLSTLAGIDGIEGTLSPSAERQILQTAGGNPLLLDQLARFLRESEALVTVEGGWRAARDLGEVGLPDDARALLGARLDSLAEQDRVLLQDAAVAGRAFDQPTMAALGAVTDDATIERLCDLGLLRVERSTGELAFRHAMVREAAYASVPLGERASKHAVLARWLADRADGDVDEALVAHHFERAVAVQRELASGDAGRDEELVAAAGPHLVAAARAARQRDELREAERWYQRARDLGLVTGDLALTIGIEHAGTLVGLRRLGEAEATFRSVADAARPGTAFAGDALTGLGVVARLGGDTDQARDWFDAARGAWQEAGDLAGEATSVRTHGWTELIAGRPRAALPKLLRAQELDRVSGNPPGLTLQCLAWSEYLIGDHNAARSHLWEAAQALAAVDDRAGLGWCFGILGNSLWLEGKVSLAQTIAENLLTTASELSEPWGEGMCFVLLASCQLDGGAPEDARSSVGSAIRAFAELGDPWGDANARLIQGMVERVDGNLSAARAALSRGLTTAQEVASVGTEARLRAELAATLLDTGDPDGAAREARATLSLVRSGGGDRDSEIRALVILAKRARALGEHDESAVLLDEAISLGAGAVRTSIWRRAVAMAAIQAADEGDVTRAQRLAADALSGSWESARTWVLAQRAVAAGQAAGGNQAGALATLDAVVGRFRDRPLAFVTAARDDIERLSS
jgi:class 3 adenylate cyclase